MTPGTSLSSCLKLSKTSSAIPVRPGHAVGHGGQSKNFFPRGKQCLRVYPYPRILTGYPFRVHQCGWWHKTHYTFSGRYPPTNVCQLFLDGCQRLLVEVRIVMKVFSQVSTIPGGPEKQKLVLYCSYKRTAAQYLAISLLSQKTLPSVTKPPGVGQVSHRQWASG